MQESKRYINYFKPLKRHVILYHSSNYSALVSSERYQLLLKNMGNDNKRTIGEGSESWKLCARTDLGGVGKFDHISPVIKELKWFNVTNKIEYDIRIFMYKLHSFLPGWIFSFPIVGEINNRAARQFHYLYVKRTRTDIVGRSISVKGPKLWNDIPVM